MSEFSYIYGLIDPRTDELRYIGKAKSVRKRFQEHCLLSNNKANTPRCRWLRQLLELEIKPILVFYERTTDWASAEIKWIALFRSEGAKLTNVSAGGEDMTYLKEAKSASPYAGKWTPLQQTFQMLQSDVRSAKRAGNIGHEARSRKVLAKVQTTVDNFIKKHGEAGKAYLNFMLDDRRSAQAFKDATKHVKFRIDLENNVLHIENI